MRGSCKVQPIIIDGEWLQCHKCKHDWPVMWRDESQIVTVTEINGRCISCGSLEVVLYER